MTEDQNLFGQRSASLPMVYTDPSAVAAAESVKARIQAAYIMALQKPRKEMEARDAILRACQRTEFAGKADLLIHGRWMSASITRCSQTRGTPERST